jgi:type VI secretion system secreted protein VgrG
MQTFNIRLASSHRPLEGVHVRRLLAREAISELFRVEVDIVCGAESGLPEELALGAEVSLIIEREGVELRRFHGLLVALDADLEAAGEWHSYRLIIVPRFHYMNLVHSSSVFTSATVEDVLSAKFGAYEFAPPTSGISHDFELQLLTPTPRRELIVQYGESDFAFVTRLAEHRGISFILEQEPDRERVVFTDYNGRFRPCRGAETVPFSLTGNTRRSVFALVESKRVIPGFFHLTDYNYRAPQTPVRGQHALEGQGFVGGIVEQDAHATTPEEAAQLARLRAEEALCRQVRYLGKSTVAKFAAGTRTTVTDHPRLGSSGRLELLLVEVRHQAVLPTPWEETIASDYSNEFVAIPADCPFRPERKTPRPKIPGLVTGIIQPTVSPDPNALATLDEHGRYRVQFHFDLEAPDRPATSSWLRMAQPFEGGSHGMHFPLRPGTEVIIGFANGDPDRPVIVGAMPNALAPSPVTAKDAHLHRIKSPKGMVVEFGPTRRRT